MIIGIDGNEANVKNRVGIGEYASELLRKFAEFRVQSLEFIVYLKDNPRADLPRENENWKYRVIKPGKLWTQWRLPLDLYLRRPRPDVFFSPSHYAPRFSPVPTVMSIMDVSYLYFPEMFNKSDLYQLRSWTAYSVKNAKKVLTISKSSKNDIIKEYRIPSSKVFVTYPGIKEVLSLEPRVYGMKQIQSKYGVGDKFILFVGTLQPRKNIVRLIEAFSKVLDTNKNELITKDLELVIIGKKGWLYEEILGTPKSLGIEERVKFLEDVNNDDLTLFYKNAVCFVLPSLYEGFGLPIIEAMQHNCPVITSNVSSLPEVGGDACLYMNPEDSADIADKIEKLISNEKLRKELIEKGKKQVAKFSWEKTAKETLAVLEEVAKK